MRKFPSSINLWRTKKGQRREPLTLNLKSAISNHQSKTTPRNMELVLEHSTSALEHSKLVQEHSSSLSDDIGHAAFSSGDLRTTCVIFEHMGHSMELVRSRPAQGHNKLGPGPDSRQVLEHSKLVQGHNSSALGHSMLISF